MRFLAALGMTNDCYFEEEMEAGAAKPFLPLPFSKHSVIPTEAKQKEEAS